MIEASAEAQAYALQAYSQLKNDVLIEDKAERDLLKAELVKVGLDVLERRGEKIPTDVVYQRLYGEGGTMMTTYRRETPIVPIAVDETVTVGLRLSDDVSARAPDKIAVTHLHLSMYEVDTGQRIGRKSAAFIGAPEGEHVSNAVGDRASVADIRGMIGLIQYMDSYFASHEVEPLHDALIG